MRANAISLIIRLCFVICIVYVLFAFQRKNVIKFVEKEEQHLKADVMTPLYDTDEEYDIGPNQDKDNLISNVNRIDDCKDDQLKKPVEFVIIACQGNKLFEWERQIRQIRVLLKSAAVLTSTVLKFNIVSSSASVHREIINITKDWPEEYRKRIVFGDRKDIYYPPNLYHLERLKWRLCTTARLFLPYVYPELDSLIFLDTDMLFMQPPEHLSRHFEYFEKREILGMAPCMARYVKDFHAFPFVAESGLNGGVILMNMTRIRTFPLDWMKSINASLIKYSMSFVLADQDLLSNVFSGENTIYLYQIDCEWNYRAILCQSGWNRCKGAAVRGVAILHGCGKKFTDKREPVMMGVFQAWEKYKLASPIKELISSLDNAFDARKTFGCNVLSNIEDIMMKGFRRTLRLRGLAFT